MPTPRLVDLEPIYLITSVRGRWVPFAAGRDPGSSSCDQAAQQGTREKRVPATERGREKSEDFWRDEALGGVFVERSLAVGRLSRLVVDLDPAAEVQAQVGEARAVASVGTDLLERCE